MTDTNRPVAFRIYDRDQADHVSEHPTHDDALRVCEGLEPVLLREDGWRYTIEPVRANRVGN